MPMFEFTCNSCNHAFEELVRSPDPSVKVLCPKCSGNKVTRQFSVFAARSEAGASQRFADSGSGCGRCGDPQGPCGM